MSIADGVLPLALERDHREIDAGIAAFIEQLDAGRPQPEPLAATLEALRRHIYLEEVLLFPPIREAEKSPSSTRMRMPTYHHR